MNQENRNSKKDISNIKDETLFFVDSNNIISQCYHGAEAIGPRVFETTIFLFMKKVFQFRKMVNKSSLYFFFDSDYSYRAEVFPFYKQHKKEIKEETIKHSVINKIKEILSELNFQTFCSYGYEADDLIAFYTSRYNDNNRVVIFSSDEDLFQISKSKVHFYHPVKDQIFTKKEIREKFGIHPYAFPIRKALVGKKNEIPGFEGIGAVTATKIINKELPFPDIDMELFDQYLLASVIPFAKREDPIKFEELKKYKGNKEDFIKIFSENGLDYYLNPEQFKAWKTTFKLK